MSHLKNRDGFTLIELVVVIIIAGILVAIAAKKIAPLAESIKTEATRQEMDRLAIAIVGNPDLCNNGVRTDFGYVGDVGAMPPDLDALRTNPGSYTTWEGPYIDDEYVQATNDFKKDAWNTDYAYSAGITITSTGSAGSDIIRRLAGSTDALLRNEVTGNLYDLDGTPPGNIYKDSLSIRLTIPNGAGGTVIKSVNPDGGGFFRFDSIPIGNHDLEFIYSPDNDTVRRFVTVVPNSELYNQYQLASNILYASSGIPGLIGHYPLNENSGQIAYDISGSALNADLQNDASGSGWSTGKIGGAFQFDGTNDYFETATTATELQISGDYSISVWIYADSNQVTWAGITCRCTPTGDNNHWTLQWDNKSGTTKVLTVYHPSGSWRSTYTLADAMNAWHHIVITYRLSPARVQLFVDGVLHSQSTSLTQGPGSGNGKFRIGCDRTSYTWRGKIDDVRIYDRVLNVTDIQTLYGMGI